MNVLNNCKIIKKQNNKRCDILTNKQENKQENEILNNETSNKRMIILMK